MALVLYIIKYRRNHPLPKGFPMLNHYNYRSFFSAEHVDEVATDYNRRIFNTNTTRSVNHTKLLACVWHDQVKMESFIPPTIPYENRIPFKYRASLVPK